MNFIKINFKKITFLVLILLAFVSVNTVSASNISPPSFAWSESVGWIQFDTIPGDVTVSDSGITGHAYNDNIGWITLDGVANDGEGNLSGYAWSESVGYIDFSDITILSNQFQGYAYNDNIGFISFNCSNNSSCGDVDYKVSTTWAPAIEEPVRTTRRSSGTSIQSQVQNLANMGNQEAANSLTQEWSHLFPPTDVPTSGISGADVSSTRELQRFLNTNGFPVALSGPGSLNNETDVFGELTRQALAKFQQANGISPAVGFFGPITKEFIANMNTGTPEIPHTVRNLESGISGADVKKIQEILLKIQEILIKKGYSIPAGATGYLGSQTQAALILFELDNDITPPTRYFGMITRGFIK